jgi:hypothetical protein
VHYDLFISHSWAYSDTYERLIALLDNARGDFTYTDHSVPKDDPIHDASDVAALREAISDEMANAQVVLVLAGVYATHSKWINEEIALAHDGFTSRIPVIAIEPRGAQRTSQFVKDTADIIVGWNTNSVIAAIEQLA